MKRLALAFYLVMLIHPAGSTAQSTGRWSSWLVIEQELADIIGRVRCNEDAWELQLGNIGTSRLSTEIVVDGESLGTYNFAPESRSGSFEVRRPAGCRGDSVEVALASFSFNYDANAEGTFAGGLGAGGRVQCSFPADAMPLARCHPNCRIEWTCPAETICRKPDDFWRGVGINPNPRRECIDRRNRLLTPGGQVICSAPAPPGAGVHGLDEFTWLCRRDQDCGRGDQWGPACVPSR